MRPVSLVKLTKGKAVDNNTRLMFHLLALMPEYEQHIYQYK